MGGVHASQGHVRRRFKTVRIVSSSGDYRYFSVYAMMAPCRVDTCFKPERQLFADVLRMNDLVYAAK